ncbi:hypothetical protein [Nostoc sp. 'Lobaria pulmonaria (5183) cyanobiont']|uniref:hypothetical protein n=1 Tax=Nostoc sp. 'Lobaria pulmonaria (5183) cyanobiont' TaxID=1618022 RepID=UPI000CF32558|nr:hypothetical protein [Nostoc sp. 'Lobaria pulmonaria (5183) cyanobiont']AVH70409.1 hypothetical protein NLP_1647 [Nostoc sp. 'Lobaria pulmonaria (5183) cyanobiont']
MVVNLNIQADIIDIKTDNPQQGDIFLVDTNVWFWQTYTNAGFGTQTSRFSNYLKYINQALVNGATLTYSGLILAELAHIIEKTEYNIYTKSHGSLPFKEYRHNYPNERMNVVAEVQSAWSQVKTFAVPVNLTVDDATTDAALNRFQTQAVDGYDLLLLEAISRAGAGKIKIITHDMDYAVVPDIQVFTSNNNVIQAANIQKKLSPLR